MSNPPPWFIDYIRIFVNDGHSSRVELKYVICVVTEIVGGTIQYQWVEVIANRLKTTENIHLARGYSSFTTAHCVATEAIARGILGSKLEGR